MNWSHPTSWFISFHYLSSLFCSRTDLAVPLKMSKLTFASGSLYLPFFLFLRSLAQMCSGLLPTMPFFYSVAACPRPCSIFLRRTYSCLKWCMDLYTHTSHTALECCWKLRLCLLIAVLTGPDSSSKSVNVLWSEWTLAQDWKAFIEDLLEMFWRLVGFGSYHFPGRRSSMKHLFGFLLFVFESSE